MWEDFYVDTDWFTKPIKQFSLAIWDQQLVDNNLIAVESVLLISQLEIINMTSYFIVIQKLLWINKYKHGLYQLSVALSFLKKELIVLLSLIVVEKRESHWYWIVLVIDWLKWDNSLGSASRLVLVVGVALIHYPTARLHLWFMSRCAISARLLLIVENLRVQTCQ